MRESLFTRRILFIFEANIDGLGLGLGLGLEKLVIVGISNECMQN